MPPAAGWLSPAGVLAGVLPVEAGVLEPVPPQAAKLTAMAKTSRMLKSFFMF